MTITREPARAETAVLPCSRVHLSLHPRCSGRALLPALSPVVGRAAFGHLCRSWRAQVVAVGAEHAAVTGLRAEQLATASALVEVLAGLLGHHLARSQTAHGAHDGGLTRLHVFTVGGPRAYASTVTGPQGIADRIRTAYETADVGSLSDLLKPDVRWGDDEHPNRCRNRDDVMRTFSGWLGKGVSAEVLDTETGAFGVALRLHVNWTDPTDRARGTEFFHVFIIRDEQIAEIRRYNDSRSAKKAIIKG